jgi:hypothetical protein
MNLIVVLVALLLYFAIIVVTIFGMAAFYVLLGVLHVSAWVYRACGGRDWRRV